MAPNSSGMKMFQSRLGMQCLWPLPVSLRCGPVCRTSRWPFVVVYAALSDEWRMMKFMGSPVHEYWEQLA